MERLGPSTSSSEMSPESYSSMFVSISPTETMTSLKDGIFAGWKGALGWDGLMWFVETRLGLTGG